MTKKQKSVKEAWCIERINSKGNLFYLQVEYTKRHAEESLRIQGRNSAVTYRIRKWKAVTVCEIIKKENRCAFKTGCGEFLPWIINYCPYCGGKIRVRK